MKLKTNIRVKSIKSKYKKNALILYNKLSKLLKTTNLRGSCKSKYNVTNTKVREISRKTIVFAKQKSYTVFVIIPTVIAAVYLIVLASPRYESTAIISLKKNSPIQTMDNPLMSMLGSSTPTEKDSYLLIDYINSPQMLDQLQKHLSIKSMYQNSTIDFISRLSSNASNIDFLDYYNKMLSLSYNIQSNTITINVQGYTPEQSKEVLENIIKNSQEAIDYISHTLAQNRLSFSTTQLKEMKNKALDAQNALVEFQNERGIVDPESSFVSKTSVIGGLKGELSTAETELTNLKSYMNSDTSEIKSAEQRIEALKIQIEKEQKEFLAKDPKSRKNSKSELSDLVSNYQWIKLNAEFTMTEYQTTLQSFEIARLDNQSQQSYLVEIVHPTLPNSAKYPRTLYNILTVLIILSALYGLGRMIVTIIIENR